MPRAGPTREGPTCPNRAGSCGVVVSILLGFATVALVVSLASPDGGLRRVATLRATEEAARPRTLRLANVPMGAGVLIPPPEDDTIRRTFKQKTEGACLKFVHNPKTGGTTVESMYNDKNGQRLDPRVKGWGWKDPGLTDRTGQLKVSEGRWCVPWHTPPMHVSGLWKRVYEACDTFCTVRHPLDRVVSEWQYLTRAECDVNLFTPWARKKLLAVRRGEIWNDGCHWLPQHMYVFHQRKGYLPVRTCDHILRFEQLNEDFNQLMEAYNYSMRMGSRRHNTRETCNLEIPDDIHQTVREIYAADYGLFGYS